MATAWPWPRWVEVIRSSSRSVAHHAGGAPPPGRRRGAGSRASRRPPSACRPLPRTAGCAPSGGAGRSSTSGGMVVIGSLIGSRRVLFVISAPHRGARGTRGGVTVLRGSGVRLVCLHKVLRRRRPEHVAERSGIPSDGEVRACARQWSPERPAGSAGRWPSGSSRDGSTVWAVDSDAAELATTADAHRGARRSRSTSPTRPRVDELVGRARAAATRWSTTPPSGASPRWPTTPLDEARRVLDGQRRRPAAAGCSASCRCCSAASGESIVNISSITAKYVADRHRRLPGRPRPRSRP